MLELDLASTIEVNFNLITLWRNSASKPYSFKVILIGFKIIINRNLI